MTKVTAPKAGPDGKAQPRDRFADPAKASKESRTDYLRMELAGSASGLQVTGANQLSGKTNYLVGNDPANWHSNVPTYEKVRYTGVYPGVDLVYYGNQRQLEYDFVVAPGADARPVRLRFAGAKNLSLHADGDLTVSTHGGQISFHKPVVYQMEDGKRQQVSGRFTLLAKNEVGFRLGKYDHSRELTIDPVLSYSTYLGGGGLRGPDGDRVTIGSLIALDKSGNAYVAGNTTLADYPTTPGAFQTKGKSAQTVFVTKLNATGTAALYSTYLSGHGGDNGFGYDSSEDVSGIAVDAEGDAYVVGATASADFPTTSGAYQPKFARDSVLFVTKLNPGGSGLVWSTFLGGITLPEPGAAIALDSAENVYVTGTAILDGPIFPTTPGAFQTYSIGDSAPFVTKLNSSGSALIYSTFIAAPLSDGDGSNAIAVDASGCAYIAGKTFSPDFPVTPNAFQKTFKAESGFNYFVAKLNPEGTGLIYSTYLGGTTEDNNYYSAIGLGLDGFGNVYIAGGTYETDFPITANAFQKVNTFQSGFISKLSETGSTLVYSTYLGGTEGGYYQHAAQNSINGLAVDVTGHAYVTGWTGNKDFPVTSDAYQRHKHTLYAYDQSAFLSELDKTGSALTYSTYLSGNGGSESEYGDEGYSIAIDKTHNAFLYGGASSPDFPTTAGAYRTTSIAPNLPLQDSFVAKFATNDTAPAESVTLLTADVNSQNVGSPVTFTATVSAASGADVPTGSVNFIVNNNWVAEVPLDAAGHASYTTSSLPVWNNNTVTALYRGVADQYTASNYTVTEIVLGPIAAPTFPKQGGTYPTTARVTLEDTTLGAKIYYTTDGTTPTEASTPYNLPVYLELTATVKAIAAENGQTSSVATATFKIVPSAINTTTTLMSSANPSLLNQPVTFTATVTAASGPTPTGMVTFKHGAVVMGSATLSGGVASFTTSNLTLDGHGITAAYRGSDTDLSSQGSLQQQVNP